MRATLLSFVLCLGAAAAADQAFVGARIIDGTGKPAMEKATLLIRNGKIEAIGPSVKVPSGVQTIDAAGKTIIPGLINAHGHVGNLSQLNRYAHFGVTTVLSLGGDKEIEMRDQTRAQQQTPGLTRSRLFIAGPIPAPKTAQEGRKAVDALAAAKVDIAKIRIDDQLGTAAAMTPEVYTAIIDETHKKGMRIAVHIVKLADAKAVLRLGADVIAHSVRDAEIDDEFIGLMKKAGAFYIPTFLREVSTFAYGDKPEFLKDPFLLKDVDQAELAKAQDPQFQASMRNSKSAQWYKEHLDVAMRNMKKLLSAGVPIAMGTDTGPPQRFQGYFEHLELEYMVKAGMTPMQALLASTSTAARCLKAADQFGTLEKGKWADLLVLSGNPLDDVRNTRKLDSVWIAGNLVR
jgi:imidazolonepropionase-like amidohydrolase